mmetsp:Transcript_65282/g.72905  ORF Transcript_65282/g.72905 Transcript_65282/m.72905 type:complete len:113 (-) Transcript_65282:84-422(-)
MGVSAGMHFVEHRDLNSTSSCFVCAFTGGMYNAYRKPHTGNNDMDVPVRWKRKIVSKAQGCVCDQYSIHSFHPRNIYGTEKVKTPEEGAKWSNPIALKLTGSQYYTSDLLLV